MKRFHYYCEGEFRYAVNGEWDTSPMGNGWTFDSFAISGTHIVVSYGYLWSIALNAKNLPDKEYQR